MHGDSIDGKSRSTDSSDWMISFSGWHSRRNWLSAEQRHWLDKGAVGCRRRGRQSIDGGLR
jgi:hypothetical protein